MKMTGQTLDYHKTYPNLPWSVAESLQLQMQTLWAVEAIRDRLESQLPQEAPQASETSSPETPSSLQGIGPTEDGLSGSNTFSETYFLARAEQHGALEIMAMATLHAPNSRRTLGSALNDLRDHYWTPINPVILGLRWPSGAVRLTIPAPAPAGPTAGGSASSPEPSPAPSHEAREEMADGSQGCNHEFRLEINGLPDAGGRPLACYKCGQGQYYTFSRRGGAFQSSQEGAQD